MQNQQTHIAYILDRSGSMQSMTEAAISGFNEFLREQKAEGDDASLTLVLFDDQYEVPYENLPIGEVPELNAAVYTARGSTALLDAVGKTIDTLQKDIKDRPIGMAPANVIVAIFTDGYENSSLEFDWKQVSKKIRDCRENHGWEFLFLAAHQDAIATASQLSIDRGNSARVYLSREGVRSTSKSYSRKISAFRQHFKGASLRPADLDKPMEEIVQEEGGTEDNP